MPALRFLLRYVLIPLLLACLFILLLPMHSGAQEAGWKGQAELGGSLFFGVTPQTILTTQLRLDHNDSSVALTTEAHFTYGETHTDPDGVSAVNRRSWLARANLTFQPLVRHSAFTTTSVESSLEKRVRLRMNLGVGDKITFARGDTTQVDLSFSVVAERSALYDTEGALVRQTLARGAATFHASYKFDERMSVTHESYYRPEVANVMRFTAGTNNSVAYQMFSTVAFKLGFLDNYDSEARARGARSNNDGQLTVGLIAQWG